MPEGGGGLDFLEARGAIFFTVARLGSSWTCGTTCVTGCVGFVVRCLNGDRWLKWIVLSSLWFEGSESGEIVSGFSDVRGRV